MISIAFLTQHVAIGMLEKTRWKDQLLCQVRLRETDHERAGCLTLSPYKLGKRLFEDKLLFPASRKSRALDSWAGMNQCHTVILVVYHLIRKPGWSTGVVNGKRQNPNGNFHKGFAAPFTVPSDPIRKAWNWSERANGTHSFRSEIPFGNFDLPFKKSRVPRQFSISEDEISLPFTFQPKFPDFFCKW